MRSLRRIGQLLMFFTASLAVAAVPDVQVNGLLPNQAVVTIDGQQHLLKTGKASPEGVTLVSADSRSAVFEFEGKRFERGLSKQIASTFAARDGRQEVRINRGSNGQFFTVGQINRQPVDFLVDTGAYTVAISMQEADRLGIDWRHSGKRITAGTANGATAGYEVMLDSISVGAITLHNIKAAVIVSDDMGGVLLGMSFLEQTEMHEENDMLVLRKKY